MRSFYITILLATILLPPTTEAGTLFVSPNGDGTNGQSWQAAFTAIGDAVVVAVTGDEVWVRHGTYNESILLATPVALLGGFEGIGRRQRSGKIADENKTFISGDNLVLPMIRCTTTATVDGFVLGGSKRAGFNIANGANVTVRNCRITSNLGEVGLNFGGGMGVSNSEARIIRCEITDNRAFDSGGGIEVANAADVTMEDCIISGNDANGGGGVSCVDSSLTMRRCIVTGNTALSSGQFESVSGGLSIGGIGVVRLENCLVYGNRADRGDQIVTVSQEVPAIFQNCTVLSEEGQVRWTDLPPVFRSTVLWGAPNILFRTIGSEGDPDVSYSCVEGEHAGTGNISDDPLFVDEAGKDFHLQVDSPCLDTADTEGPSDDLDRKTRPLDVPGVGREGDDAFDMGVYEFQPPPVTGGSGIRLR